MPTRWARWNRVPKISARARFGGEHPNHRAGGGQDNNRMLAHAALTIALRTQFGGKVQMGGG